MHILKKYKKSVDKSGEIDYNKDIKKKQKVRDNIPQIFKN